MDDVYVYKISDKLYRVRNGDVVKDVWFLDGKIVKPDNKHNILTEEELDCVMDKIIND